MKRVFTLCGVLGVSFAIAAPLQAQPATVLAYLPDESSLEGWEPLGDPQTAEGDDLFLLINGGAEIYNEYGFLRAVMHSYDKGDMSVNLEIYEMEDVASAYGAYSFKTGRDGEYLDIGSEARFEDYYLNFWKGNVVVTLVGFDTDEETRDAILTLARLVESKITVVGSRPDIVDLLPGISPTGVSVHPTYVEGNLGLINRYRFGSMDLFGFSRAVVGDYVELLLFAIPYGDETDAAAHLGDASRSLSTSGLYSNMQSSEREFTAIDGDGQHVMLRTAGDFIVACVGEDGEQAVSLLETLAARVEQYSGRQEQ